MSDEVLKSIDEKLTMMTKLIALDVVKGRPFAEQVEILDNAGMTPAEIAACLRKTPNNIRVTLHSLRKRQKGVSIE